MYTVGKGFLCTRLRKANVVYCIPARSLAAVAVQTATVCTLWRPISTSVFSETRKFTRVYGLYSDRMDVEAGRLEEFSPLGRSVRKLWHGLAVRLASGRDLNSSHTLLERLRQERASSRPRVCWELAVHV